MSLEILPWAILASSLLTGVVIFLLREERRALRTFLNLFGATAKLGLVGFVFYGAVVHGYTFETRYEIVLGFDLLLRVDLLSLMFLTLSSVLWFLTTLYAIGYLEGSPNRRRFFGFFSLCVTASTGIALAGNLITFFIFYEFLTLVTYPLIVHRGTEAALKAGRVYLCYTIIGGAVLFVGVAWLHTLVGTADFGQKEALLRLDEAYSRQAWYAFFLVVGALGVKAALVPLHGWLPVAMVAPAPVSALLHAVAVVKAGAFGIVRVIHDVYGIQYGHAAGLTMPVVVVASFTILYGSARALMQDDLKKRLAYSTISQISFIVLGVATMNPMATVGGLVHIVHQGIMKITLFFCAGNAAETLGLHRVSEMAGSGRKLPLTMGAFTVGALGMIGVPPVAGFISKWYLGIGAVSAGQPWIVAVLAVSTLLNAAYFLPIVYAIWFEEPLIKWKSGRSKSKLEAPLLLLLPPLVTAALSIGVAVFANTPFSPLDLARQIASQLY